MSGNRIPERWLREHDARVAEQMAQHRLDAWILRELGDNSSRGDNW